MLEQEQGAVFAAAAEAAALQEKAKREGAPQQVGRLMHAHLLIIIFWEKRRVQCLQQQRRQRQPHCKRGQSMKAPLSR